MITYRIIGADGRQYGPAAAEQIRQWLAEGRATPQTLAQADGGQNADALDESPEASNAAGDERHEDLRHADADVAEVEAMDAQTAYEYAQQAGGDSGLEVHPSNCGRRGRNRWHVAHADELRKRAQRLPLADAAITTDAQGRPMRD